MRIGRIAAMTLGLVLAVAACHRAAPEPAAERPTAPASSEITPPVSWPSSTAPLPPELAAVPPPLSGEAKRTTLAALELDPLLRAQLAVLREHFGADGGAGVRGPFLVQRIERAGGGSAALVSRSDESDPIVLAIDRDRLVFARGHPTAGITPPARHATLAPGPERGVALFSYVPTQHLVAARMWAEDGNPFAEIVALTTDSCDALSVAYAARWGWILACSSSRGTRAQRLREDLTGAWGPEGVLVGTLGPAGRPVIAFEDAAGAGPSVWTLTQRAKAVGGDRTLGFRYGPDAQPMPSSSTSKTSVDPGGMTGGKPRSP